MPSSLWSCLLLLSGTRYYLFNSASSYPWPGESQVKYYEPEKAFLYYNTNPCDDNGFRTYRLFFNKNGLLYYIKKGPVSPQISDPAFSQHVHVPLLPLHPLSCSRASGHSGIPPDVYAVCVYMYLFLIPFTSLF